MFRRVEDGSATGDVFAREAEALPGRTLLQPVMRDGRRLRPRPVLPQSCAEAAAAMNELSATLRILLPAAPAYTVAISPALDAFTAEVRARVRGRPMQGAGGGRADR